MLLLVFTFAGQAHQAIAQTAVDPGLAANDEPSRTEVATEDTLADGDEKDEPTEVDAEVSELTAADIEEHKNLEEIVVTGRSTQGALDFETADSITSFDASDLEAFGAGQISDLSAFTPNLEIVAANPTSPNFFIRGVGLSDFSANAAGAVAIFYDDVAINSPALQSQPLFDVETVNILRGPQGAGPNRNASAGAIKVYARKPDDVAGGNVRFTYGNYNYVDVEGGLGTPIVDGLLSSRIAFRVQRRDGYGTNRCAGAPLGPRQPNVPVCADNVSALRPSDIPVGLPYEVNDLGVWAIRGQLRFQPDLWEMDWLLDAHGSRRDQLSPLGQAMGTGGTQNWPNGMQIRGELGGQTTSGYKEPDNLQMIVTRRDQLEALGLPRSVALEQAELETSFVLASDLDIQPRQGDYNRVGNLTNDTMGTFLRGDMSFGKFVDFTTITSFDRYDRFNDQDVDSTSDQLIEIVTDDDAWQFGEDLRFSGEVTENLRWNTGGYFLMEELSSEVEIFDDDSPAGAAGVSTRIYTQDLWSWGIYAGLEFDFWDDLTLDGGARFNWERKTMDYLLVRAGADNTANETRTWSAPTGSVRLKYRFTDTVNIFMKYGRGWKAGHFNAVANLTPRNPGLQVADPETLDAWEAGFRGSWFDNRFAIDTSFFYYKYDDYQVFTFSQGFRVPPELAIINANDAENYGAEVDIMIRPIDQFFTMIRFGWLESQYLDFTQENTVVLPLAPGQGVIEFPILIDNTGNRLINSPQFQVSLTAQYEQEMGRYGSLIPRYDGAWKSDTYFDPTEGRGPPNAAQGVPILPPNTIGQEAYWLHNLRLSWLSPRGNIEVSGWVRNLTDEVYKSGAFNASNFAQLVVVYVGEPRTYGFDVKLTF